MRGSFHLSRSIAIRSRTPPPPGSPPPTSCVSSVPAVMSRSCWPSPERVKALPSRRARPIFVGKMRDALPSWRCHAGGIGSRAQGESSMDTPILSQGAAGAADADLIKNTSTKDFMRDVIDASREVPVLVDFWAPWCGPCRQLTPIMEKAVRAAKGAVKLVKLNIDEHPQIPGQMGVQSIPAVFAFQDGKPVDGFMGALPEARIKSFIARLIGDESADAAADLDAADEALAAGDANTA